MQLGEVDMGGVAQVLPPWTEARAVMIAHDCAEGGEKAGPTIGARAAADANDDIAASVIECLRDHGSKAMTSRGHRSGSGARKPLQAADLGHLHNRGFATPGVRSADHLASRSQSIDAASCMTTDFEPREAVPDNSATRAPACSYRSPGSLSRFLLPVVSIPRAVTCANGRQ
jgi:hypothetical protein